MKSKQWCMRKGGRADKNVQHISLMKEIKCFIVTRGPVEVKSFMHWYGGGMATRLCQVQVQQVDQNVHSTHFCYVSL